MELFEKSDFENARKLIKSYVKKTPLEISKVLSELNSGRVFLKCENEQTTGSFKLRGAIHSILVLKNIYQRFVTASSGNHGLACAHAFSKTDTSGIVFLPSSVDKSKLEKLKSSPLVDLKFVDGDQVLVEEAARKFASEDRLKTRFISPYNDVNIIRGQGTCGLEIMDQCPDVDYVFVTVGGGGLASGVLVAIKSINPNVKIVGCQPDQSPVMMESVNADKIIEYDSGATLSDGSAGGIEPDSITFDICKTGIDRWVSVSEAEIRNALYIICTNHNQKIIEGAAGVAVASFIKMAPELKGKYCVIISCGGNINHEVHAAVIQSCQSITKKKAKN